MGQQGFGSHASGPLLSVIVPVFNGERFLEEAVDSIWRQAHRPLEIVVVDDGSTDRTREVAGRLGDRVRYHYQPNAGASAARNTGLGLARGELISFLDVDDLWPRDRLARLLPRLLGEPAVDMVMGRTKWVPLTMPLDLADAAAIEALPDPPGIGPMLGSLVTRRAVVDRIGPFDPTFRISHDLDWFIRAKEAGVAILVLDRTTLIYRKHPEGLTGQSPLADFQLAAVLKRSLDRRRAAGQAAPPLPTLRIQPER